MEPLRWVACIAAEPASIIYIVTGAVGLALARLRRRRPTAESPVEFSSVLMLFCRRTTRELFSQIGLT